MRIMRTSLYERLGFLDDRQAIETCRTCTEFHEPLILNNESGLHDRFSQKIHTRLRSGLHHNIRYTINDIRVFVNANNSRFLFFLSSQEDSPGAEFSFDAVLIHEM